MSKNVHPEDGQAIEKLIAYMKEHAHESFDIEKHARMIGFSVSKLNKTFKAYQGVGPATYFRNLKMEKARKLYEQNTYTWTEISSILGYADLASFSKAFKRIHGFCPRNATSGE